MRISDWSSDVCSSDLRDRGAAIRGVRGDIQSGAYRGAARPDSVRSGSGARHPSRGRSRLRGVPSTNGGAGMRPQAFNYILEKESANDQAATIVKLCAVSGSMIREGDHVLDIETSKAVQEVHSPWTGMLMHGLTVGDEPSFGSVLFSVLPEGASLTTDELLPPARAAEDAPPSSPASEPAPGTPGPRISPRAAELARELGVDTSTLTGGFITVDDIRRAAGNGTATATRTDAVAPPIPVPPAAVPPISMPASAPAASATPDLPGETVAPTARKRQEIRTDRKGTRLNSSH